MIQLPFAAIKTIYGMILKYRYIIYTHNDEIIVLYDGFHLKYNINRKKFEFAFAMDRTRKDNTWLKKNLR